LSSEILKDDMSEEKTPPSRCPLREDPSKFNGEYGLNSKYAPGQEAVSSNPSSNELKNGSMNRDPNGKTSSKSDRQKPGNPINPFHQRLQ